jgi:uncharacterized protein with ParB-like and HNH nuclease domain
MEYKSTISNIFSPRKISFAVPNYQRAYSWEVGQDKDRHVPQFLKDIEDHPTNVEQYHYGHFLFEQDIVNKNKYWIIDGQQRLTTAIIFLSCIYNRLKGLPEYQRDAENLYNDFLKNNDELQKFETVDYDNNFFINTIIDSRVDIPDTKSRRRILEAYEYLSVKVNKADITTVIHWKELVENAKITTDTVEDKAEATQIFTFQNDRGKSLTNLEKLKAFLMLQIFLSCKNTEVDPNNAIRFVENEFETIYKSLENIEIANEDQILNYHTIAFLQVSGNSIDRVKNVFKKQPNELQQRWIKKFAVELKKSFELAVKIQNKRKEYSNIADVLYLDQANSFPLILKLYHLKQENHNIELALRLMEIILFKWKYTTGNYQSNYFPEIANRYNGDFNQLINTLRYHSKRGFKDYWNFEGNFEQYLSGNNHYTSLTKYLLWKFENSLREEIREPFMLFPEFNNLYGAIKLENTIDHWLPQNPYGVEYDQEFNDKYLHNIGNLVLSTRGRNASDSNHLPSDRSTFSTLISRQKLEPLKNTWSKENIEKRKGEIVIFAKNYWNPDNLI